MCTCPICFDTLNSPIALPCGHVFCQPCLVQSVRMTPTCPTCRRSLPIAMVDPTVVPSPLKPYFQAPLRRLYIDPAVPAPGSVEETAAASERARLQAENAALRECCSRWRHFADMQAAAQRGLVSSGRAAAAYARALRDERDALRRTCAALKRKHDCLGNDSDNNMVQTCGERPGKRPERSSTHERVPARLAELMAGPIPSDILDMCGALTRRPQQVMQ